MPDINLQNNNEELKYEVQTMADDLNEIRNLSSPAFKEVSVSERFSEPLRSSFIKETPVSISESKPETNVSVPPSDLPIEEIEKKEASTPVTSLSNVEAKRESFQQIIKPEELISESLKPQSNIKKLITISFIIFTVIILGVLTFYYIVPMFKKSTITPTPVISETPTPIVKSILNLATAEDILLINNTTEELFNVLSALVAEPLTEKSMEELKINSASLNGKKLDLINIFETLNINYPQELFFIMNSNYYEMFLYSAKNNVDLGFIMEIQNKDANSLKDLLSNWENTMIDSFKPFYFGRAKNPDSFIFKNSNYKGINIRYINLNTPETAIDYAIYTDLIKNKTYWLFSTSKDSMFAAIDRLVSNQ